VRRCLVLILSCLGLVPGAGIAQIASDAHTVTVQVNPINILAVNISAVNLTIDGSVAVPGQDLMVVSDASTMLLWGSNSSTQKITISSSLATPQFVLRALAVSPSVGTPGPELVLGAVTGDLILGVGRSSGSSQIRYTGEALASQGVGTDTHVITFTVVAQ